jgi:hypothetical protein
MWLASTTAARAGSAAELLAKGIYTEETKGELSVASQIYQQIVDDPRAERSLVAQAQLRLGLCELKQGHKPQAISALERLTQDFPDKDKLTLVAPRTPQLDDMVKQISRTTYGGPQQLMKPPFARLSASSTRAAVLRTNDMEFIGTNELAEINGP